MKNDRTGKMKADIVGDDYPKGETCVFCGRKVKKDDMILWNDRVVNNRPIVTVLHVSHLEEMGEMASVLTGEWFEGFSTQVKEILTRGSDRNLQLCGATS